MKRARRVALVAALVAGSVAGPATRVAAAAPFQVVNLDPMPLARDGSAYSVIGGLQALGRRALFVTRVTVQPPGSSSPRFERGLWVTDGTASGTRLLRVFAAGDEYTGVAMIGAARGRAYFVASDGTGPRLWTSDGTGEGTVALTPPAVAVRAPNLNGVATTAILGGRVLFAACRATSGCEPWVSDGTPAGTRPLGDLLPGPAESQPAQPVVVGGRAFFFAAGALWSTDGTAPGTRLLAAFGQGAVLRELTRVGTSVFFLRALRGTELWRSDGTATGTRQVRTFAHTGANPASGWAGSLLGGASRLYFLAAASAGGVELWSSDGSRERTVALTALPPLPDTYFVYDPIATIGDRLLFFDGQRHLWASGGTPRSTRRLHACTDGCPDRISPSYLGLHAQLGSRTLFVAHSAAAGDEIWTTDGAATGTRLAVDLCPGPCDGRVNWLFAAGDRFYFTRSDANGTSLWTTDATAAGTVRLLDGGLAAWSAIGSDLLVALVGADTAPRLWRTDGTPAGSGLVASPAPAEGSAAPRRLTAFGDRLLFTACDGEATAVWISGLTPAGTFALTRGRGGCGLEGHGFRVVDGVAYFLFEGKLWRSDGTPLGTAELADSGGGGYYDESLWEIGGRLVWLANLGDGTHLWRSDGSAGGTAELPLPPLRYAVQPVVFGSALCFHAEGLAAGDDAPPFGGAWCVDVASGETRRLLRAGHQYTDGMAVLDGVLYIANAGALFRSDGTAAGTQQLIPGGLGPQLHVLTELVVHAGALFFVGSEASDYPPAMRLYRSNGTAFGTVALASLGAPGWDAPRAQFTPAGTRLFFTGFDAEHGFEPWTTDGTAAGTGRVADLAPGPAASRPHGFTAVGAHVVFAANDGEHGEETWASDGTAAGTRLVADLAPLAFSSSPSGFCALGDRLLFTADDGTTGDELWALPLDEVTP